MFGKVVAFKQTSGKPFREFAVQKEKEFTIGRDDSCDLTLVRDAVQPIHAKIIIKPNSNSQLEAFLIALAPNETKIEVRGRMLNQNEQITLRSMDYFILDSRKFQFIQTQTHHQQQPSETISPNKSSINSVAVKRENENGASPPQAKKPKIMIFQDIHFLLTSLEAGQNWIRTSIVSQGGIIEIELKSILSIDRKSTKIICISPRTVTSNEFLFSLSNSIPCVSLSWIRECIDFGELREFGNHLLLASEKPVKIEQTLNEPLRLVGSVFCVLESKSSSSSMESSFSISNILKSCKATVIDGIMERKQGRNQFASLVLVCDDAPRSISEPIISEANEMGIRVVDQNWLYELIWKKNGGDFFSFGESQFDFLPYPIRVEIFRFLNASELGIAQRVSKRWNTVCKAKMLWRTLVNVQTLSSIPLPISETDSITNFHSFMKLFTKHKNFIQFQQHYLSLFGNEMPSIRFLPTFSIRWNLNTSSLICLSEDKQEKFVFSLVENNFKLLHLIPGRLSILIDLHGVSPIAVNSMLLSYTKLLNEFETNRLVLVWVQDDSEMALRNAFKYKLFRMKSNNSTVSPLLQSLDKSVGAAANVSDELYQSKRSLVTYNGNDIFGELLRPELISKSIFEIN